MSTTIHLLKRAQLSNSDKDIAIHLGVSTRTITRWIAGETEPPVFVKSALKELIPAELPIKKKQSNFKFIDLFAGIGGIRLAFERVGGECVYTSEWDTFAQKTYGVNYGLSHPIDGDITEIDAKDIPSHDVLLAGFPCQPFSIAGVSKKNALGKAHGFSDETQGTLFFDLARIIQEKKPKAFLLENVKNLTSHDKGRTFDVIKRTLTQELGYVISYKVIDAAHFLPQHRERILIVGFRESNSFNFEDLILPEKNKITLASILHKSTDVPIPHDGSNYAPKNKVLDKYTLSDKLWQYLQNYAAKHKEAGNGFGFGLVNKHSVARTLSARYYKDGSEILVDQGNNKNPRRLTPRECARLMGFPDDFIIPVSDTRAYKQFGNSVAIPVMEAVAKAMLPYLKKKTSK
jgi:DNA (cytosine-5)-methyltransferase 1